MDVRKTNDMSSPQIPNWFEFAASLPKELPDEAYDSLRTKFFNEQLRPLILQRGFSSEDTFAEWWKKTERPEKASFPRAQLVGRGVVSGLMAPVAGMMGKGQELKEYVGEAALEAQKQGISPDLYQMGGEMVGMAPWLAPSLGLARAGTSFLGATGAAASQVTKILLPEAVGVLQGAYDAASAEPEDRASAAAHGFAVGTLFTAGFEAIGPLWRLLRSRHRLTEAEAKAVDAVSKGIATEDEQLLAAKAAASDSSVVSTIREHSQTQKTVDRVSAKGVDVVDPAAPELEPFSIEVLMPNGKTEKLTKFPATKTREVATWLSNRLKQGGKVVSITGDEKGIVGVRTAVDQVLEQAKAFEVKMTPRKDPGAPPPTDPPVSLPTDDAALSAKTVPSQASAAPPPPPAVEGAPAPSQAKTAGQVVSPVLREIRSWEGRVQNSIGDDTEKVYYDFEDNYGAIYIDADRKIGEVIKSTGEKTEVRLTEVSEVEVQEAIRKAYGKGKRPAAKRIGAVPTDFIRHTADGTYVNEMTGEKFTTLDAALGSLGKGGKPASGILTRPAILGATNEGVPIPRPFSNYPSSTGFAERPLASRFVTKEGVIVGSEETPFAGLTYSEVGEHPIIYYTKDLLTRGIVYHETNHALVGNLGLTNTLVEMGSKIDYKTGTMWRDLLNALDPLYSEKPYVDFFPEEVWNHLNQAIRLGDEDMLQSFIDADLDRANVLGFARTVNRTLLDNLHHFDDSLHKRVLERRLEDILRRTGTLAEKNRQVSPSGLTVRYADGNFHVVDEAAKKTHVFDSEANAASFMERHRQPLSTPELADFSSVPPEVRNVLPKPATTPSTRRRPTSQDPTIVKALGLPEKGRIPVGLSPLTFLFTPFYSWLDTVSRRANSPYLYEVFGVKLKQAAIHADRELHLWKDKIVATGADKLGYEKLSDIGVYLGTIKNKRGKAAVDLHLTNEEIEVASKIEKVHQDLERQYGRKSPYTDHYFQQWDHPENIFDNPPPSSTLSKDDIAWSIKHARRFEIDFEDKNALSNLVTFARLTSKDRVMGEAVTEAKGIVNAKNAEGKYALGTLRPLFQRHLDYMDQVPDYSDRAIRLGIQHAYDSINEVIPKVNKWLPADHKLGKLEPPADAMQKYLTLSFASTMGWHRPISAIRDSLQVVMTTYPLLGEKYFSVGMRDAWKKGAFDEAQDAGALMFEHPLSALRSTRPEMEAGRGKVIKFADWLLTPMTISNNANRMVSYFGHKEQALDALKGYLGHRNPKQFLKESSAIFLDDGMKSAILAELPTVTPSNWEPFVQRVAKEMTEISQWNYHRGAQPGAYKFAVGRLLGQYGTWPLNYISFIQRILRNGDAVDKSKVMTRLMLAHTTIFSAMEGIGIDAGQWILTQPISYSGGPLFQTVTNLPQSFDFESDRGREARDQLVRQLYLSVPTGLAFRNIWTAIAEDKPDKALIFLGFQPMKEGAHEEIGLHGLLPP